MSANDSLDRLAQLHGITPSYRDNWGNERETGPETKVALLQAMGVAATTGNDIAASLDKAERRSWERPLPPVLTALAGEATDLPIALDAAASQDPIQIVLDLEDGSQRRIETPWDELSLQDSKTIGKRRYERRTLSLPGDLPTGYHTVTLETATQETSSQAGLIVAPGQGYAPEQALQGRRSWGFAVQIYGLRSGRNWGLGDFGDLGTFAETAGGLGADVVGINPVHAMFPADPGHFGPYAPSNRMFLNAFYLDVEALPDVTDSAEGRALLADPDFRDRLKAARDADLVDYPAVWHLKSAVLEPAFGWFRDNHLAGASSPRAEAFRAYCAEAGTQLERHALFDALHEHMFGSDPNKWHWRDWPEPLRRPGSPEAQQFADEHEDRITYFKYLQWLADEQLGAAQHRARASGMAIGLYRDLAVASDSGGSMAWAHQGAVADRISVGAPPDAFSPKGQDWGVSPLSPAALEDAGFEPFVSELRANMRHAGALRIDHVMGLQRLFWIPEGAAANDGAYVSYPFRDLLRIVALESQRNRCIIIGEDLGTLPEGFRPALRRAGLLSYQVLYFERDEDGGFKRPGDYSDHGLVTATTHDLPTLDGFWLGRDLSWRDRLGLFPSAEASAAAHAERERDRQRLAEALTSLGLGLNVEGSDVPDGLIEAVYRYLSTTPSPLLMVAIEDALAEREQPNLPGTMDEHPNWRRKLRLSLERLFEDPKLRALVRAVNEARRGPEGAAAEPGD